ncbi:MAG TPA: cell envelope integrity protein TolA [Pseudolabrys sp.]|jgi:colicin import membrane protein|nr:cell envelope integrity protein TolA [Pseudolabrys sp.]
MQFRTASVISTGLHTAVLLWALVSFTGKTLNATPTDSLPVDIISDKEFSEMTKGVKDAPKPVDTPKPLVEKKEEQKSKIEDFKAEINEKREVKATAEKSAPAPQAKPDPIADKIKKIDNQVTQKEPEPLPPKKPPQPKQPKFDANKIAALLDQRAPERKAVTGETPTAPTLGTALGNASQLSQSELDALRARLMALWNPPVGIQNPEDYVIRIRIRLDRSGRLTAPPMVLSSGRGQVFDSARDSAIRAVFQGQPFTMLKPEHYDIWKDIEVTFDPREMFGG